MKMKIEMLNRVMQIQPARVLGSLRLFSGHFLSPSQTNLSDLSLIRHFSKKPSRAKLIQPLKPPWEDFVSTNVNQVMVPKNNKLKTKYVLENQGIVLYYAQQFHPEQLQLSVVTNLCEASKIYDSIAHCEFNMQAPYYDKNYEEFEFKERIWLMSQTWETPMYQKKRYQAINFKLPNDGFVYSPLYSSQDPNAGEFEINESHPDVETFCTRFLSSVRKIDKFEPELAVNFNIDDDRLELYFKDVKHAKLLTVKFEPGPHLLLRHVRNLPKSLAEWEKRFASNQANGFKQQIP